MDEKIYLKFKPKKTYNLRMFKFIFTYFFEYFESNKSESSDILFGFFIFVSFYGIFSGFCLVSDVV